LCSMKRKTNKTSNPDNPSRESLGASAGISRVAQTVRDVLSRL